MQDLVMRNPPYQEEDGGAQASAKPVYNLFVEAAKRVSDKSILIMPARWYAGGRGLDSFREEMLNDNHLKTLHDFPNTNDCFPNQNIRGGVCIVYRDEEFNGDKEYPTIITHNGSKETKSERSLSYRDTGIFMRNSEAVSILDKVISSTTEFLSDWVSPLRPFGLRGYFSKDKEFRKSEKGLTDFVKCFAKGRQMGFVKKQLVPAHHEWINTWKVFIPRADNVGTELNDDNVNSFVGCPGEICTESLLMIGANRGLSETEAKNLSNYLRTNFARFLHSLSKSSQDATSKTWRFVPVLDFAESWDDQKLFEHFGLNNEEKVLIKESIKEMS